MNGEGARCHRLPGPRVGLFQRSAAFPRWRATGFASGVRELDAWHGQPAALIDRTTDEKPSTCASLHRPASPGVMRPLGATAVAFDDNEPCAAPSEHRVVRLMPVVQEAIASLVLAHR